MNKKIPNYIALIIIILSTTIIWGWLGSSLILYPPRYSINITPQVFNIDYEDVQFLSSDGIMTNGFFIPAKKAKGTIIVLHGYGANKSDVLSFAEMLNRNKFNTLVFDFRAHGKTKGKCTLGINESKDVIGAVNYLISRNDIDSEKIGVLGCSMGACAGIIAAAKDRRIKAIVTDSCFDSFESVITRYAKLFFGLSKYPFVPPVVWFAQLRGRFNAKDASPAKYISQLSSIPVFLIGSQNDVRIPPSNQDILYSLAKEPKEIWIVPNAGHLEANTINPSEYEKRVILFFDKYLKNP